MTQLIERFLRYVRIDTQSNPDVATSPSTEKQKDLSRLLVKELRSFGLDASLDEHGYVYAKIEGNVKGAPAIGFIAHVDTSPDAPGQDVKPRIIANYGGEEIVLNDTYRMSPKDYPSLSDVIGDDIIVTDGTTLLGADDKCGVAEIMELARHLTTNRDIPHGDIHIGFTPDEEIGRGADRFDLNVFTADFAYTVDGSAVGGIDYENFNAATANLTFTGISIHPGTAKNKLVNAIGLAHEFDALLPEFLDPAYTEKYEGFNHQTKIHGQVEETKSQYIIRNHDRALFEKQKQDFAAIRDFINARYGYPAVKLEIKDSYYNMYEVLKDRMDIVERAKRAIESVGITPKSEPIRGGTDGSRLTFMGLPCPNLGTGGFQFHGRMEFASINQMEKATEILIRIATHDPN
ncbi:MAG: peptidase T [Acholeplasmataceae bacterium]